MSQILQLLFFIFALVCAIVNLIRRQWLLNIIALTLQYVALFGLLLNVRPFGLAVIKLLVGLMVTLIIFLTILTNGSLLPLKSKTRVTLGELFRGLGGVFLVTLIQIFAQKIQQEVFPQSSILIVSATLSLVMLGLLQMGTIAEPFYAIIGLLTFFSAFELLYASLEFSNLLEALFAAVNLGLALVGAFFIVKDLELRQP